MMARVRLIGRLGAYSLGASLASSVNIVANVVFVRWSDRADRVQPSIVANTVVPVGWHQGHREGKLELGVLSEAMDAFYSQGAAYIVDAGDNVVIPYHFFTLVDSVAGTMSVTVTGSIVDHVEYDTQALEDMITIYHIKYWHATPPTTV